MATREIYRTPPWTCAGCGKLMDAISESEGSTMQPKPGDISFCFYCTTPYIIKDDYTGRLLTVDDLSKMTEEEVKSLMAKKTEIITHHMHRMFKDE